jgi:NAD(P)-dependent dehydrogenase (short-subunit alcohol dehydrogenase family)
MQDYRVVATSRMITQSKELAASDDLVLVDGDVAKKSTAEKVVQAAMERFGRVDLLVNNAGIYIGKPFTEYTEEDFTGMVNTNVASFFFMTQQVIPPMRKQKSGHVVNIATTLTEHPNVGAPAAMAVLTKSPMPAVSRELALEYAKEGIRVNTVSPGVVNTPMHAKDNPENLKELSPMGREVEVSEIVDAVLFLQGAKSVTGENIRVDGGAHAGKW